MKPNEKLAAFARDVMEILPLMTRAGVGGLASPGISMSFLGGMNSRADIANQLRVAIMQLMAYDKQGDKNGVAISAKNVEGQLLAAQTLGMLESSRIETLIDTLQSALPK